MKPIIKGWLLIVALFCVPAMVVPITLAQKVRVTGGFTLTDLTITNKPTEETEREFGLVRGKSDDPRIPVGSYWVSATYFDDNMERPHHLGISRIVAVKGDCVQEWCMSVWARPELNYIAEPHYYFYTPKKDFLEMHRRIEPRILRAGEGAKLEIGIETR